MVGDGEGRLVVDDVRMVARGERQLDDTSTGSPTWVLTGPDEQPG
jgi:hypothetical protein